MINSQPATAPRTDSIGSNRAAASPRASPEIPSTMEPARCPSPQASVTRSVLAIDQPPARAIATNGT